MTPLISRVCWSSCREIESTSILFALSFFSLTPHTIHPYDEKWFFCFKIYISCNELWVMLLMLLWYLFRLLLFFFHVIFIRNVIWNLLTSLQTTIYLFKFYFLPSNGKCFDFVSFSFHHLAVYISLPVK